MSSFAVARRCSIVTLVLALFSAPAPAPAQSFSRPDSTLERIWNLEMRESALPRLAQVLLDSIGPRLAGSPAERSGHEWLAATYRAWGIPARAEQYGTWKGWRRGPAHVDLVQPRVRTLQAWLQAWSPGTRGAVTAPAVVLPDAPDSAAFAAWLPSARGKLVLLDHGEPTCRPDSSWQRWARPEAFAAMARERVALDSAWRRRIDVAGGRSAAIARLARAGAVGVLTSAWRGGWGSTTVADADGFEIPSVLLDCEDYGLVSRLASHAQGPVLRVDARADDLGEVSVHNTIAELRGREHPDEYVLLSAHFDSWDGGSGATDNGTGTLVMMEAMRLLHLVDPQPRRTIIAGHWGGEEMGHHGSISFAKMHPEVLAGIQVGFNDDIGTGRIATIALEGFADVGGPMARWLSRLPAELTDSLTMENPGLPGPGGSDYATFDCRNVPVFNLLPVDWDYETYTHHTPLDTYDKISFDDLRRAATLVAMLAYQAAEDAERVGRGTRTAFPNDPETGQPITWPSCREPLRSWGEYLRSR